MLAFIFKSSFLIGAPTSSGGFILLLGFFATGLLLFWPDLLNDWDTLHNSAQMGAIRALANDGHKSAAHIEKQTSNLLSRAKALGRSLNLAQVMATPEAAPQHEDVSQEDLAAPTPKPPKRLKLASCDDTPTNQPSIHSFLSPSSNSSRNSSGSVE